jgi:phospholipid-transporting ATPase
LPLLAILVMTAIKEMYEDFQRRRQDDKINKRKVQVLKGDKWVDKTWSALKVGDIVKVNNKEPFPADLILMSSSESTGVCYIGTSNLDGETNLKVRQCLNITATVAGTVGDAVKVSNIKGSIDCEQPNKKLYDFNGSLKLDREEAPLSTAQLLLRGSKLINTTFIVGTVVYSGHESKLMKNSQKVPLKDSSIQKMTNIQIIFLFFMLLCISLFAALFSYFERKEAEELPSGYVSYLEKGDKETFMWNFVTFVILLNNLIPISLQFTLEFVKLGQSMFINWDKEMFYPDQKDKTLPGTFAYARTSNLNEELGQIKYVFSDKTGTLTQNIMLFRFCAIKGIKYSENDKDLLRKASASEPLVEEFMRIMSVCHTVIPDKDESGKVEYNASSPDEKAFVDAARDYGFEFLGRTPDEVTFKTWEDKTLKYTVLAIIEFTSSRKRMSALMKTEKGEIKLYTKGADSVILERVAKNGQEKVLSEAQEQIDEFAREGLRTMALGMRDIPQKEFDDWHKEWQKASLQISNRKEALDKAATLIEKELVLVGITAIEDKLQDHVPD